MESKTLLDREELAMDVKEAAKRAAAYTADIETVMDPKSLSEFLSKSGFAIESTHFDDALQARVEGAPDDAPESGLYPCGEGAGYAGGIMSAAADGLRVAEMILEELNHE